LSTFFPKTFKIFLWKGCRGDKESGSNPPQGHR